MTQYVYAQLIYVPVLLVLDSEVVDLRVCLQSADRELAEVKADLKGERHRHQSKIMEHMQTVSSIVLCKFTLLLVHRRGIVCVRTYVP